VIDIYEEDHQDYPAPLDGAEAGYEVTWDDISNAIELIIPSGQEWCEKHQQTMCDAKGIIVCVECLKKEPK
jgi:hypothetical protein